MRMLQVSQGEGGQPRLQQVDRHTQVGGYEIYILCMYICMCVYIDRHTQVGQRSKQFESNFHVRYHIQTGIPRWDKDFNIEIY
jgi:hypothetical protein